MWRRLGRITVGQGKPMGIQDKQEDKETNWGGYGKWMDGYEKTPREQWGVYCAKEVNSDKTNLCSKREKFRGELLERYPREFDLVAIACKVKYAVVVLTVGLGDLKQTSCLTNTSMQ